jgi:hypothetical protein
MPAFRVFYFVSTLPNLRSQGANRRKSPATPANIPVLQRLSAETGFDHHCRPRAAVANGSFCAHAGREIQTIAGKICQARDDMTCPPGPAASKRNRRSKARASLIASAIRGGRLRRNTVSDRSSHAAQTIRERAVVVTLVPKIEDGQNDKRGHENSHLTSPSPSAQRISGSAE